MQQKEEKNKKCNHGARFPKSHPMIDTATLFIAQRPKIKFRVKCIEVLRI